jgi:hypothetical protein
LLAGIEDDLHRNVKFGLAFPTAAGDPVNSTLYLFGRAPPSNLAKNLDTSENSDIVFLLLILY